MPIYGLSDKRRLTRLGKIKLGVTVEEPGKKAYPRATDYLVCPPEVQRVFGERPTALRVMFPHDDPDVIFPQFLKAYTASGLFCAGDGRVARRWTEKGDLAERECPCEMLEDGRCKRVATLNVMLPEVPGIGVYQITTSNKSSIVGLNSNFETYGKMFGGLAGIPFTLRLEPEQTQRWDDERRRMVKTTIHTLRLDSDLTLRQIMEWRAKAGKAVEALPPAPETDAADAHVPDAHEEAEFAPLPERADSAAPTPIPPPPAKRESGSAPPPDGNSPAKNEASAAPAPQPAAPISEPPAANNAGPPTEGAEWDVSLLYKAAWGIGISTTLYDKYLTAVYGTPGSDLSEKDTRAEAAALRAVAGDNAKGLVLKADMIRRLNEALKRKGK